MSRLLPLLAVILSAAALGMAISRPASQEAPAANPGAQNDDELVAFDRRIELLEETTQHLEQRLTELSRRPAAAGGTAEAPAGIAHDVAQLRTEVRAMIAGEALQSEGGKAYLRDAVRGVQEELAAEERKARTERFAAAQAKSQVEQKERWKKFVTEAGLDYTQEQTLNRLLEAESTMRRQVMDQVRDGKKTFGEVRSELRASREQTDQSMKTAVNAEQFKKYTEQRREGGREGRQQR
jgi:hypothetical protein